MTLGYIEYFKDGTPTYFEEQIKGDVKIHTLREDPHDRWKVGRTIHHVVGNRTSQRRQFALGQCKSTQKVVIHFNPLKGKTNDLNIYVDDVLLSRAETIDFINNDGFLTDEKLFIRHFLPQANESGILERKLINFTNFRY